ncbi:hypothetical protein ABW19_dt0202995 [Dactylella cylindrospora]|nr:hypothetical protein ABW19_dt0202995 [Dactylella cylindrospora]
MTASPPPILAFAEDTNQLVKEYESFVHSIALDDKDQTKVHIETKERMLLVVQMSTAGWKILSVQPDDAPPQVKMLEGESYEGPEGFLMAASDEFKRLWHAALMQKLSALDGFRDDD